MIIVAVLLIIKSGGSCANSSKLCIFFVISYLSIFVFVVKGEV